MSPNVNRVAEDPAAPLAVEENVRLHAVHPALTGRHNVRGVRLIVPAGDLFPAAQQAQVSALWGGDLQRYAIALDDGE